MKAFLAARVRRGHLLKRVHRDSPHHVESADEMEIGRLFDFLAKQLHMMLDWQLNSECL
jgi:hypothetical protein